MSENLDLVRSIYADWERGDFRSANWADPGIELVIIGGAREGRGTGLTEMAEDFREFASAWEGYRAKATELRELDDEHVLVLVQDIGRGKASGLELGELGGERAMIFELRSGKVRRLTIYWDRDRALADLGLEG
jgi:ketosteroid isomerase-like protein